MIWLIHFTENTTGERSLITVVINGFTVWCCRPCSDYIQDGKLRWMWVAKSHILSCTARYSQRHRGSSCWRCTAVMLRLSTEQFSGSRATITHPIIALMNVLSTARTAHRSSLRREISGEDGDRRALDGRARWTICCVLWLSGHTVPQTWPIWPWVQFS